MATSTERPSPGSVAQVWLPYPLDRELRKYAEGERRSLSSTIRIAVEDALHDAGRRP